MASAVEARGGLRMPELLVITLDGETLFTTPPLAPGFSEVSVGIPGQAAERMARGPTVLGIRASTGTGDDPRQLGVVVDSIRIEPWQ